MPGDALPRDSTRVLFCPACQDNYSEWSAIVALGVDRAIHRDVRN